jgi:hypothetical protein
MSRRIGALALLATVAVAAAVLQARGREPERRPSAGNEMRLDDRREIAQAVTVGSFAEGVGITPGSVEDLGVFSARSGPPVQVLTGRRAADGRQCLIVRDAGGSGQSCAHDLFAHGPVATLETFRADADGQPVADYHLVGLAGPTVKRVDIATSAGMHAEVVPTPRGAFVFTLSDDEIAAGASVERLVAHDASGSRLGEVRLPTRQLRP